MAYKLEQEIALWEPGKGEEVTTDPFKVEKDKGGGYVSLSRSSKSLSSFSQTLFVSRISYYTSESKLRREFESFGPIKKIVTVQDEKSGKPRGYCFIEYEHERDMHCESIGENAVDT